MIALDSSTIISFAISCSLRILENLRNKKGIKFYIGRIVYKETVLRAREKKRYKYQAYRIDLLIKKGVIELLWNERIEKETFKLMDLANNLFFYRENPIELVHPGEMEAIAIARNYKLPFVGVDEKTTRLLIEDPLKLKYLIESKTHRKIEVDERNFEKWARFVNGIKVVRSIDLAFYSIKKNLVNVEGSLRDFTEGLLYSLKYSGCSASEREIKRYLELL